MDDGPGPYVCLFLLGCLLGGCVGCSMGQFQGRTAIKDKRMELDRVLGNSALTPEEKDILLDRIIKGEK